MSAKTKNAASVAPSTGNDASFSLDNVVEQAVSELPTLVTISVAAEFYGCSERTIRSRIAKGLLLAFRPSGGPPRIPRSEIARDLRGSVR